MRCWRRPTRASRAFCSCSAKTHYPPAKPANKTEEARRKSTGPLFVFQTDKSEHPPLWQARSECRTTGGASGREADYRSLFAQDDGAKDHRQQQRVETVERQEANAVRNTVDRRSSSCRRMESVIGLVRSLWETICRQLQSRRLARSLSRAAFLIWHTRAAPMPKVWPISSRFISSVK